MPYVFLYKKFFHFDIADGFVTFPYPMQLLLPEVISFVLAKLKWQKNPSKNAIFLSFWKYFLCVIWIPSGNVYLLHLTKTIQMAKSFPFAIGNFFHIFKWICFAISSFAITEEITSALNFADWHYFCGKMFTFLL